jgi:hypothetical membrane protein
VDQNRRQLYAGVLLPAILLIAPLLATLLAPGFKWTDNALSNLGRLPAGDSISLSLITNQPEFFVFNGGLVAAGLVGLPFGKWLFDEATNHLKRAGACVFLLSMILLSSIGVFYIPHDLHGLAAIGHFLTAVLSLLIYGAGMAVDGRLRGGLVTAGCGVAYVCSWVGWGFLIAPTYPNSIAIPEFISGWFFGGWVFVVAASQLWELSWPGERFLEDSNPESVEEGSKRGQ